MASPQSPARDTIIRSTGCSCCAGKPAVSLRGGAVTDPVCGMAVSPSDTTPNATHDGELYYFCAAGCRHAFERDPGAYVPTT